MISCAVWRIGDQRPNGWRYRSKIKRRLLGDLRASLWDILTPRLRDFFSEIAKNTPKMAQNGDYGPTVRDTNKCHKTDPT